MTAKPIRIYSGYLYFAAAVLFVTAICFKGAPVLRHDWDWPLTSQQAMDYLVNTVSGWQSAGIGNVNPYPSGYVVAPFLAVLMFVSGDAALVVYFTGIAAIAFVAARLMQQAFKLQWAATFALYLLLLFNPWTYNEIVAGHHSYVLSCFAFCALCAAYYAVEARWNVVALALILSFLQIQVFAVAVALSLLASIRDRRFRLALGFAALIALPTIIGIWRDRSSLGGVPFYGVWEQAQAVLPLQGFVLRGYFTGYDRALPFWSADAMYLIAACAWFGAAFSRRRDAVAIATAAAAAIIFSGGARGPLGAAFAWLVANVRIVAVFRELYGVLSFTLAAYFLLIAFAESRVQWTRYVAIFAGVAMGAGWYFSPPARFWIGRSGVPSVKVNTPSGSRFALAPMYQPVTFRGKGGIDPDAYGRTLGRYPLNQFLPSFPVSSALADAGRGSFARLQNLGAGEVVYRPWLGSDTGTLFYQGFVETPTIPKSFNRYGADSLRPVPIAGTCSALEDLLIVDGRGVCKELDTHSVIVLGATADAVNPSSGWVDTRWLYVAHPELGQTIGGMYTTSRAALLVTPGWWILANTRGYFESSRGKIDERARGYLWLHVPAGVSRLTCIGTCTVLATARSVPRTPLYSNSASRVLPVTLHRHTPWFLTVTVSSNQSGYLRYAEAYDPGWAAFVGLRRLRHVSIDTGLNGWLLPNVRRPLTIQLLHVPSAIQAVAEGIGWLAILVVLTDLLRSRSRTGRLQASRVLGPEARQ